MSRYFADITVSNLQLKCGAKFSDSDVVVSPSKLRDVLGADLKVDFDFDNFEHQPDSEDHELDALTGFVTLGHGLCFWGMWAGGDWEHPVYFIVYWDGRKLRGYVPTEGNPWNTDTNKAYGNDAESDYKNALKRWPEFFKGHDPDDMDPGLFDFEPEKIFLDITRRITRPKR